MVSTATASGSQARSLPVAPTQEQSGPGMTIWGDPGSVPPGQVTVSNIVPDSSADHAGIQAGDVILQVDGRSAGSAQINTIAEELWGPTDSLVHVKLKRGTQIYDVTLLRENVTLEYLRCSQNIQHGNPDRQGEEMKTQIEQNLNVQAMLYEQALMQSLIRHDGHIHDNLLRSADETRNNAGVASCGRAPQSCVVRLCLKERALSDESLHFLHQAMDMMVILTRDQNGNVGIFYGTEELSLPTGGRKQQEEVQTTRDESWLVLNLVPLGPADKSQQLRKGDRILTVDGESASSLDASQLATALHGSPGSLVAIRVARRVQYERQVSATRSSNGGVGLFFWSLSYCSPRLPF